MTAAAATIESRRSAAFATAGFPSLPFALRTGSLAIRFFRWRASSIWCSELPADSHRVYSGQSVDWPGPNAIPVVDLDPAEVVRRIETLWRLDWCQHVRCPSSLSRRARTGLAVGGARQRRSCLKTPVSRTSALLVVSSPNATTPFHVDAEDNIFAHIHGEKFFTICDNRDGSVVPTTRSSIRFTSTQRG